MGNGTGRGDGRKGMERIVGLSLALLVPSSNPSRGRIEGSRKEETEATVGGEWDGSKVCRRRRRWEANGTGRAPRPNAQTAVHLTENGTLQQRVVGSRDFTALYQTFCLIIMYIKSNVFVLGDGEKELQ